MRYNFTQLPAKLPYPPNIRGKLSTIHSKVVSEVIPIYSGSFKQRKQIVDVLNTVSYDVVENNSTDYMDPSFKDILNINVIDSDICKSKLGSLYIIERDINWDINPVDNPIIDNRITNDVESVKKEVVTRREDSATKEYTPKSDLFIQPPLFPRFNFNKVFAAGKIDDTLYTIYSSEPRIPKRQNEISVTTDVSIMTDDDFLNLYPNQLIKTRAEILYDRYPGMNYHHVLGSIIPIEGFSEDQIVDNIIKYPHIFKLYKKVDFDLVSFYTTIEIDNELHKVSDIWKSIPESSIIPYNADFIKEYVVRRYLLERDVKHIEHKYPMYGTLLPYLTLFTSKEDYIKLGYADVLDIAKQCVISRISYKTSRNPVLRRLSDA